ncbi:hypothetical protein ABH975_006321 [Bradyrhizobium ottawaense]
MFFNVVNTKPESCGNTCVGCGPQLTNRGMVRDGSI